MKLGVAFIILIHGLIHLMGFIKSFRPEAVDQLTQPISRPIGFMWFSAALLFMAAMVMLLFSSNYWWVVTIGAIALSQSLILSSWSDARFGTVANILVFSYIIYSQI